MFHWLTLSHFNYIACLRGCVGIQGSPIYLHILTLSNYMLVPTSITHSLTFNSGHAWWRCRLDCATQIQNHCRCWPTPLASHEECIKAMLTHQLATQMGWCLRISILWHTLPRPRLPLLVLLLLSSVSVRPCSDTWNEISVPHSPIQNLFPTHQVGNGENGNENDSGYMYQNRALDFTSVLRVNGAVTQSGLRLKAHANCASSRFSGHDMWS